MTLRCWLFGHRMIRDMDSAYARCDRCGFEIGVDDAIRVAREHYAKREGR